MRGDTAEQMQRVMDRLGFIVISHVSDLYPGHVVNGTIGTYGHSDVDTKLVVIGRATQADSDAQAEIIGIPRPCMTLGHIYRVVAE